MARLPSPKSLLFRLYAYRALDDGMLIYPLYSVMFTRHGLSALQIGSLFIIWSLTKLVCEIPTGALADRFSRKQLLGIAQLLRAAGFTAWLLWPAYPGYALGFILWGIGGTFISGTFQALVFDELKSAGRQADYVKITGRADAFSFAAGIAAKLVASPIVLLGFRMVLLASIATCLLTAIVGFSLPAVSRRSLVPSRYRSLLVSGAREALRRPELLGIVLFAAFLGALYNTLDEYTPLYVQETGVALFAIPLAMAAVDTPAVFATALAHRFEHRDRATMVLALALTGMSLIIAGIRSDWVGIAAAGLFAFFLQFLLVLYGGKLQKAMSGQARATVTSVAEFAARLAGMALYFAYGYIATRTSNARSFLYFGLLTAIIAAGYGLHRRRRADAIVST